MILREKKFPGLFDRQMFDILDRGNGSEEGLFSDVPQMNDDSIPMLTLEQPHQPLSQFCPTQGGALQPITRGADKGRDQEKRKRKRNNSNTNDEKARRVQSN